MKPLDSEKNLTFMNHPERVAAQKELDEAVLRISTDIKVGGSAMYYLTILPPILKKLEAAVENLNKERCCTGIALFAYFIISAFRSGVDRGLRPTPASLRAYSTHNRRRQCPGSGQFASPTLQPPSPT